MIKIAKTQKATKIEIILIFKFRILVLEFRAKILYVVNFVICYTERSIQYTLSPLKLWKYFEQIKNQLLSSTFE